ncbi:MAG: class I SAM-dependent methyltransferase [Haloferacaceae archaeon]
MVSWDERFRNGDYPRAPDPDPVLRAYVDSFPDGRALDVATGTGRNAIFLASHGYRVDAIDQSEAGLKIAGEEARERGVADRVSFERADATEYEYTEAAYDVVTISFFRTLDRLADVKAALAPGGVLFYQHHLRTTEEVARGPSTDRYRFASNELLRACLDLTVLHYEETSSLYEGRPSATVTLVARNTTGGAQSYPEHGPLDGE